MPTPNGWQFGLEMLREFCRRQRFENDVILYESGEENAATKQEEVPSNACGP
jgi:hypothetical protein